MNNDSSDISQTSGARRSVQHAYNVTGLGSTPSGGTRLVNGIDYNQVTAAVAEQFTPRVGDEFTVELRGGQVVSVARQRRRFRRQLAQIFCRRS